MDADTIITWNVQNFITVVLMAAIITVVVLFTAKFVRGKFGDKSA
jgi:hypothetical protein